MSKIYFIRSLFCRDFIWVTAPCIRCPVMDLKHLVFYHNTVFIFIFPVISVSILVYGKIEFSLKPLLEWGGSGGEGGGGGAGVCSPAKYIAVIWSLSETGSPIFILLCVLCFYGQPSKYHLMCLVDLWLAHLKRLSLLSFIIIYIFRFYDHWADFNLLENRILHNLFAGGMSNVAHYINIHGQTH